MSVSSKSNAGNCTKDKGAFPPLARMAAMPSSKRQLRGTGGRNTSTFNMARTLKMLRCGVKQFHAEIFFHCDIKLL
jgi:hypothetical protein